MAGFLKMLFRRDMSSRLQDGARKWARTDMDDVVACAELAKDIADIPRNALQAEIERWHPRADFIDDRARRLLLGVRDGVVPPVDLSKRGQFAREEELGRMPLDEAFECLAATHPELRELGARARAGEKIPLRDQRPVLARMDEQYGNPGWRIVATYLGTTARGKDNQTPLFDRRLQSTHATLSVPGSPPMAPLG